MNRKSELREQVARLTANPSRITDEWLDGRLYHATTAKLTAEIRADARIPRTLKEITPAHLPAMLEWRLRLDAMEEQP